MKILIIDNDMTRQRNLRSILTSIGFKSGDVDSVDEPTNSINMMKKKRPYGLVFIYREMGNSSGLSIVKDIRANLRWRALPIIMCSQEISKDVIVECVDSGANGVLGYPFSVNDVEAAMKQTVGKKKKFGDGKIR